MTRFHNLDQKLTPFPFQNIYEIKRDRTETGQTSKADEIGETGDKKRDKKNKLLWSFSQKVIIQAPVLNCFERLLKF